MQEEMDLILVTHPRAGCSSCGPTEECGPDTCPDIDCGTPSTTPGDDD
jgi:hypothetical protein